MTSFRWKLAYLIVRFHFIANAHKKTFAKLIFRSSLFFLGGTYEKVRKNYKNVWGGVLVLSVILALSLMFASCANSSDSNSDNGNITNNGGNNDNSNGTNNENPSPTLPANVGENPITKTIKLKKDRSSERYLELKADGTAIYGYEDESKNDYFTYSKLKYTYDADKKTITMRVEKSICEDELMYIAGASEAELEELLTYNEICSKINEYYTVKKIRAGLKKELYEDKEWLEDRYPDCDSYEKFESEFIKQGGFKAFDDYVKYYRSMIENYYKSMFSAQITFFYNVKDGKITLTEKFTGLKNLFDSDCEYGNYIDNQNYTHASIDASYASIRIYEDDVRYSYEGTLDTDKKTIDFVKQKRTESDDGDYEYEALGNVTATYTEDISGKTVTINCEGKEYVCEFEGQKFVQE